MSWSIEDGRHEGYIAAQVADGRWTHGSTAAGVVVGDYDVDDEVLPYTEVVGWSGKCECGWAGVYYHRVTDPADADPAARKLHIAPGEDAAEPYEAEDEIHLEWRVHVAPHEAITRVETAATAAARAQDELTTAVHAARNARATWADIGRAVGITRQSAQERWATGRTRT